MRKLLALPILAAIVWSGWWVVAQQGITRGIDTWLQAREGEGWQAEAEVATRGFPLTLETRLTDLALADPDTGLAWNAPVFSFTAAAYAPTRVTATWPETQTIASPFERIEIRSQTMQGFLGLVPGPNLALDDSDITLEHLTFASTAGWTAALASGSLVTRRLDEDPLAHDIRFATRDLEPAAPLLRIIDPTGLLPQVIAEMTLEARVAFDAPWDRRAIEDRRPQITRLELEGASARWGDMALDAAGSLTVDPKGTPEGRITIRATNWRDMVAVARASGSLPEGIADTLERGLEILAGLTGNPRTIDAPLSFQNGFVSLGPIPLGRAPAFVIR
ncbi:DUF2125 domain-containing protein [Ovoidimarina sediminis]|uniref:DUF2125 domain-containing protein n=1 Tax=Ovoidimarina sediminis TaxID=3079856 RepID=UPI0029106D79|nr:DUF2125 domain-containing protein [Rhodophyticola sp. MJ-SS7]MDU8943247.1 DUF2125 domain-containing protein [Rhodophyticola sp. MJ-SS7]